MEVHSQRQTGNPSQVGSKVNIVIEEMRQKSFIVICDSPMKSCQLAENDIILDFDIRVLPIKVWKEGRIFTSNSRNA
uniref:Uncharacterized protein n=1 Tax=Lepeophtheirus salmonis TaxID=72036 RepID=A0A0K2T0W5_LEPSM